MHVRRTYYRIRELSCFLYNTSLPFFFLFLLYYRSDFCFLRPWPIATKFSKGVAVPFLLTFTFWTVCDQNSLRRNQSSQVGDKTIVISKYNPIIGN
jgi:hypothetical protein